MSGFGLNLTFDDLGITQRMDRLANLGGPTLRSEVLEPIGATLEATTLERFDTGIGPDGEAWEPSLRVKLFGGQTLVETGILRDSYHYEVETSAVEIGSADIRAAIHQFGGFIYAKSAGGLSFTLADGLGVNVDRVEMPERPVVGLSIEDRGLVEGIAGDALARAVGGTA